MGNTRIYIFVTAAVSGFVVLPSAMQRVLWILFLSAFVALNSCGYEIGIMPPIRCNRMNYGLLTYESACEQHLEQNNDPSWDLQHPPPTYE